MDCQQFEQGSENKDNSFVLHNIICMTSSLSIVGNLVIIIMLTSVYVHKVIKGLNVICRVNWIITIFLLSLVTLLFVCFSYLRDFKTALL